MKALQNLIPNSNKVSVFLSISNISMISAKKKEKKKKKSCGINDFCVN